MTFVFLFFLHAPFFHGAAAEDGQFIKQVQGGMPIMDGSTVSRPLVSGITIIPIECILAYCVY